MRPIAAAVATLEPDAAAKPAQARLVATASPPGRPREPQPRGAEQGVADARIVRDRRPSAGTSGSPTGSSSSRTRTASICSRVSAVSALRTMAMPTSATPPSATPIGTRAAISTRMTGRLQKPIRASSRRPRSAALARMRRTSRTVRRISTSVIKRPATGRIHRLGQAGTKPIALSRNCSPDRGLLDRRDRRAPGEHRPCRAR